MVGSARARPKGRRSYSAPQDLDATALRLDSTGGRSLSVVPLAGGCGGGPAALSPRNRHRRKLLIARLLQAAL